MFDPELLWVQMPTVQVLIREHPDLGPGPDEDASEVSGKDSDAWSVFSEDSVLPECTAEDKTVPAATAAAAKSLYQACAKNEIVSLRRMLEAGVTQEDVIELDINGRVGKDSMFDRIDVYKLV